MVGSKGFEPLTPWSQIKCSTKLSQLPIIQFDCLVPTSDTNETVRVYMVFLPWHEVVELTGVGPATSWMLIKRSPNWATAPCSEGLIFFSCNFRETLRLKPFYILLMKLITLHFHKLLVPPDGIGPSTYRLQGDCSTNWAMEANMVDTAGIEPVTPACRAGVFPIKLSAHNGGTEGDRTLDILLAKQALSQLSYSPKK